eukprot:scaffold2522_cov121-Isochrysis_galbana.AAC.6
MQQGFDHEHLRGSDGRAGWLVEVREHGACARPTDSVSQRRPSAAGALCCCCILVVACAAPSPSGYPLATHTRWASELLAAAAAATRQSQRSTRSLD